jgi:ubiquinone/menaquinone biosynthesis C-methylase UbiE
MATPPGRFNDGGAYERGMGRWSRLVGEVFLDWLAPPSGARWIDVGCGSGAFTELVYERCAPAEVHGIDPSDAQLAFARTRPGASGAVFQQGDAMSLPFPNNRFDAAVMALVIFFVPDPDKGVAEMARVVGPGGLVAAYAWDVAGGGFPFNHIRAELSAMGQQTMDPPSAEASRTDVMHALWTASGLEAIETRSISVRRTYADFDEFWTTSTGLGVVRLAMDTLPPAEIEAFKARVRARLPAADASGRITYTSRANAIKGRVPA